MTILQRKIILQRKKAASFVAFKASKAYPKAVKCATCERKFTGAHLYLVQFHVHEKSQEKIIHWQNHYPVGCSHEDYDGKSWCDNCLTIMDGLITCSHCAFLEWGEPHGSDEDLNGKRYLWKDGTYSSPEHPQAAETCPH